RLREPYGQQPPGDCARRCAGHRLQAAGARARAAAAGKDFAGRSPPAAARAVRAAVGDRHRGPQRRAPVRSRRPLHAGARRRTVARPLTLVRPELRPDLRTALHQAAKARATIEVRNVLVPLEDGNHRVNISVRPVLRDGDPARGFFLVVFAEGAPLSDAAEPAVTLNSPAEPLTVQLEEELARVRGQLSSTIEQYETQVEEAKAANEELQAMNEELRSAAEELETSKEELQSVNE